MPSGEEVGTPRGVGGGTLGERSQLPACIVKQFSNISNFSVDKMLTKIDNVV